MTKMHYAPKSHPLCGRDGQCTHDYTKANCLGCLIKAIDMGHTLAPR